MVREVYDRFVDLVCKSRKISPAELAEIADGRIFDGATAVRLNLADGFGTFGAISENLPWIQEARRYYINIVGK